MRISKLYTTTFLIAFFVMFSFTTATHASEYQCNVSATGANGCEPYSDIKHVCPFPTELSQERTIEIENGTATYPEFCTICGQESPIPSNCRAVRISSLQSVSQIEVTPSVSTDVEGQIEVSKNSILQNAYQGFKIALSKAWNWLKVASKGEQFEIKNPTTPVAGVRG